MENNKAQWSAKYPAPERMESLAEVKAVFSSAKRSSQGRGKVVQANQMQFPQSGAPTLQTSLSSWLVLVVTQPAVALQ